MSSGDVADRELDSEAEVEPGVIVVPQRTYDRLTSGGEIRLPFSEYSVVVQRKPDARSADRYGLIPSVAVGPVKLVTGVAKTRQERRMVVSAIRKVVCPGTAPRIQRLRLVVRLVPPQD